MAKSVVKTTKLIAMSPTKLGVYAFALTRSPNGMYIPMFTAADGMRWASVNPVPSAAMTSPGGKSGGKHF